MAEEHQQNGGIPSWDTWINQMTDEQREYEKYRQMYSLHCRVSALEEKDKTRFVRDLGIQAGSGFLGGLAGLYSLIKLFRPFS